MVIHVIRYSLSHAFSVSNQTRSEVIEYKTQPLFNTTKKTQVRARSLWWDINKRVKPVMNVMKSDIFECCGTMYLDEEMYTNIFCELN